MCVVIGIEVQEVKEGVIVWLCVWSVWFLGCAWCVRFAHCMYLPPPPVLLYVPFEG